MFSYICLLNCKFCETVFICLRPQAECSTVFMLLQMGAHVNTVDDNGESALFKVSKSRGGIGKHRRGVLVRWD